LAPPAAPPMAYARRGAQGPLRGIATAQRRRRRTDQAVQQHLVGAASTPRLLLGFRRRMFFHVAGQRARRAHAHVAGHLPQLLLVRHRANSPQAVAFSPNVSLSTVSHITCC
jgi:hypothetical protein